MFFDLLLYIITRNRVDTTLPLVMKSILLQKEVYPRKVLLFIQGEKDYNKYKDLLKDFKIELKKKLIEFEVIFTNLEFLKIREFINKTYTDYEWHLRLDDDELMKNDLLFKYYKFIYEEKKNENIGAVGGYVVIPDSFVFSNLIDEDYAKNFGIELRNSLRLPNVQWRIGKSGYIEVEHLHSSFIYRPNIVTYPDLPIVAHTEETIFTYKLKKKGYKLYVLLDTGVLHFRNSKGGLRDLNFESNEKMYNECEMYFSKFLEKNNIKFKPFYFIVNPNGLGDNFALKSVIDKIIDYHKDKEIIIVSSYYKVFNDLKNVKVYNILDGVRYFGILPGRYNIYDWREKKNIKENLSKCYEMFYIY